MYEGEVQQLPDHAGSGHHHFRDVLQAFVQDFSLRQAASETKVREIERQLSDATGEIHILRRLLEEYQTKLNDDNLLITRLHHEIEALQGRVSSLDKKNSQTEAVSSRLEIRLEHLKECLTQTCNDTQKGVSKLLGNFAKVHFSGDYAKNEDLRPAEEVKEQEEVSVRRKNVPTFAQVCKSDGSGSDVEMTAAIKPPGDTALNKKPDRTHSTSTCQISADKPQEFQSSTGHEYVTPTNDDSMTNECPSTDVSSTNDKNTTTAECLPCSIATYSANDQISRQPDGEAKTVNCANDLTTKQTSSQDGSNFTAKIPSNTTQDNITKVPARTRSDDNTPTSDTAHLPPVPPNANTSSTSNLRGHGGLPKAKKAPKGMKGQGPLKNSSSKQPRTTSLSEEHGKLNRRQRTTSLTEEQSNIQKQRRTASFCEDQLQRGNKTVPSSAGKEELNTRRKVTSSLSGILGKSCRNHGTNVSEEHGDTKRTNRGGGNEHGKSENRSVQTDTQVNEEHVSTKSKERATTTGSNSKQATGTSTNNAEQTNKQSNTEQSNVKPPVEQHTPSKVHQEPINHHGTEDHITNQESREQITIKNNNKKGNRKGNEKHVNKKSNDKQVNTGKEKQVNKSTEKQVNTGNEKQVKDKDDEKHVQKDHEKQKENDTAKQVHKKVSEKQVKEKDNEKQVNKSNEKQVNKKEFEHQVSDEQATVPDTANSLSSNSENQVTSHNSEEHGVAQDSEKRVISSCNVDQEICSKVSEQTTFLSNEEQVIYSEVNEQPTLQCNVERDVSHTSEEGEEVQRNQNKITLWSNEERTQSNEENSKYTNKQTFQNDEAHAKGIFSQNSEDAAFKATEEQKPSQGTEEHTNTHDLREARSQNRKHKQHTPKSSEGNERSLAVSQLESSPVNVDVHKLTPDGNTLELAPQENQQVSNNVAATTDSPKTSTGKQRKTKNKEKQDKWEESKKEETKKQEGVRQSSAKDESVFLPGLRRRSFRMEGEEEHQEQEVGMCANCGFLAKLRCANCRQAFYCKRECQREHWKKGHKDQCQPFQVMESAELGRYMVASRDLKAGDVIVKEDPLVVGPKQITEPVCLGCYSRVDGSYRCQKCQWPLCGPECEKAPDHLPECVVGQEIGSPIDITNYDEPNHFYEVVFSLRCLALKKKSPKKYEQLLALESHYEDRKGTHIHKENQKRIVNFLRNYFFIQEFPIEDIDSSERSIHNITGIIDVNALELRLKESEVLGLYPNFAMLEHSCTPNTKHTFNKDRQVVLKAAVDIKRGEHISTMYTHILWGTAARRDHLKHSKYFMCTCFRCSDPTELGTHFSALRCKNCTNGFMLSAAPLDELASWICTSCNTTMTSEVVTETNLKLGEDVEAALAMPNREALEELVQKHAKNTVHPNHFHLFAARHTLLQMYGRDPNSADEASMKKKEKMCQDFLKVCTALDPGMSRLAPYAGVALYEYHLAVLARARQDPNAKQVDSVALKKDVETAKALLQQCIRVLQDEPADQPEGQLCHVAQQNLAELRQWEATLS
ncbi:uncharacterized protein [Panulirus ornatus]|uniref:uncharacterized protein n=1 Tax=Panulirus ornatus TaxID=150431 RepID=UPI003A8604FC